MASKICSTTIQSSQHHFDLSDDRTITQDTNQTPSAMIGHFHDRPEPKPPDPQKPNYTTHILNDIMTPGRDHQSDLTSSRDHPKVTDTNSWHHLYQCHRLHQSLIQMSCRLWSLAKQALSYMWIATHLRSPSTHTVLCYLHQSVHAHYDFGCSAPSVILVIVVVVVVVVVVVAAAFSVVAGITRSWQHRPYQSGIHWGRREEAGSEHPKCLNLAKLHSTAVDFVNGRRATEPGVGMGLVIGGVEMVWRGGVVRTSFEKGF
ncbi:hypothetical protein V8F06_014442 [Rhypophila decipiens]